MVQPEAAPAFQHPPRHSDVGRRAGARHSFFFRDGRLRLIGCNSWSMGKPHPHPAHPRHRVRCSRRQTDISGSGCSRFETWEGRDPNPPFFDLINRPLPPFFPTLPVETLPINRNPYLPAQKKYQNPKKGTFAPDRSLSTPHSAISASSRHSHHLGRRAALDSIPSPTPNNRRDTGPLRSILFVNSTRPEHLRGILRLPACHCALCRWSTRHRPPAFVLSSPPRPPCTSFAIAANRTALALPLPRETRSSLRAQPRPIVSFVIPAWRPP